MKKFAVIDLGSNSIRMSIFDETGTVLSSYRSTIRLSEGMTEDMILKAEPQMRAVKVLTEYKAIIDAEGAIQYRAVATAAVRKAKNREDFLQLVKETTSIDLTVIDGKTEAALDSLAIEKTLNCENGIICDIGGGSTELIGIVKNRNIPMVSIPYGSRGICEIFLEGGETAENIQKAQAFADKLISEAGWLSGFKNTPLIGIGGTIRALAKQDLKDFSQSAIHSYTISPQHMSDIIKKIEAATLDERKNMAGIGERADIIAGGLILLKTVLKAVEPNSIAVSDAGVREGVFYDLLENRGIL